MVGPNATHVGAVVESVNTCVTLHSVLYFGFYRHTLVPLSGSSLHTHCQVCLTDTTTAPTCVALGSTIKGFSESALAAQFTYKLYHADEPKLGRNSCPWLLSGL